MTEYRRRGITSIVVNTPEAQDRAMDARRDFIRSRPDLIKMACCLVQTINIVEVSTWRSTSTTAAMKHSSHQNNDHLAR